MSSTVADFLFEAVNFLILAVVIGYLFFRPVRAALGRERDDRARVEADTARLHEEADELARKARDAWGGVDADIADHRERLLTAARAETTRAQEQAREAQAAERRAFEAQLRAAREAQAVELASVIGQVAAGSVVRLLTTIDGPDLDAALVRTACAELGPASARHARPADVESAHPLTTGDLAELSRVLGGDFTRRVVPELGAGVRITTATGQVDATAAGFARRAARDIARDAGVLDTGDGGDD